LFFGKDATIRFQQVMFLNEKSRSSDRLITLSAALTCPLPEKSKLSEDFQFRDANIAAAAVIVYCFWSVPSRFQRQSGKTLHIRAFHGDSDRYSFRESDEPGATDWMRSVVSKRLLSTSWRIKNGRSKKNEPGCTSDTFRPPNKESIVDAILKYTSAVVDKTERMRMQLV